MDWIQIAGHIGAFLSSITFIPQVYKVWRTKSVEDLSLAMMLIVATSTLIWLVYGIALQLWPVILANGVIFCLSLLLIYFKLVYSKK
jgi:MtN3 and saliva related transmembrane protein